MAGTSQKTCNLRIFLLVALMNKTIVMSLVLKQTPMNGRLEDYSKIHFLGVLIGLKEYEIYWEYTQ